jgi:hypothetical protein
LRAIEYVLPAIIPELEFQNVEKIARQKTPARSGGVPGSGRRIIAGLRQSAGEDILYRVIDSNPAMSNVHQERSGRSASEDAFRTDFREGKSVYCGRVTWRKTWRCRPDYPGLWWIEVD